MDLFRIFGGSNNSSKYGTESMTITGIPVKSKGEKIIADYLTRNQIRYEYEREARGGWFIFSKKIGLPDFYLPDYDVYVEYWGMLDVENSLDRGRYEKSMRWKMAQYHRYNIKFISLYERNLQNLDRVFRKKFEDVTGRSLPRMFNDL